MKRPVSGTVDPGPLPVRAGERVQTRSPAIPCAGCGEPFLPIRPHQRYCRPTCRITAFHQRQQTGELVAETEGNHVRTIPSSRLTDGHALRQGMPAAAGGSHRDSAHPPPRLMNLHEAASYIGVSYWTMRDWVVAARIPVVRLPPLRPKEGARPRTDFRRVVIDRADLDAFIDRCKTGRASPGE